MGSDAKASYPSKISNFYGGIEMEWNIVGQADLVEQLKELAGSGNFPQFSILYGPRGSGKTYMAQQVANQLGARLVKVEKTVEAVREIIPLAHKVSDPLFFLLENAEEFSDSAKNALLKVTEEPPQQAKFFITTVDHGKLLDTIRSRAAFLRMHPYTPYSLMEFCTQHLGYFPTEEEAAIISTICTTPGDVRILVTYDIIEFYDYVRKVIVSIRSAMLSNIFKIGSKIAFKEEDDGWDYRLFMQAVLQTCIENIKAIMKENSAAEACDMQFKIPYFDFIDITSKYSQEMEITGINKPHTFDMWLMDMRGA